MSTSRAQNCIKYDVSKRSSRFFLGGKYYEGCYCIWVWRGIERVNGVKYAKGCQPLGEQVLGERENGYISDGMALECSWDQFWEWLSGLHGYFTACGARIGVSEVLLLANTNEVQFLSTVCANPRRMIV